MSSSGTGNVAIGISTGQNVTGFQNVAVGQSAGSNVVGSTNSSFGAHSGSDISGNLNAGAGYESSMSIVGNVNTGVGAFSSNNVTGNGNTAAGASSGQSVTGSANSAFGLGAGEGVTGNSNIAIGQNAGSTGTGNAQVTQASQSSRMRTLEADATMAPHGFAVRGSNNIAIGTNAGLGTINSFSDTVAIGTGSSATQASSVAIGQNATATAANAVAIGAGSVANQANTVSVGAPGSERRITNVAPAVNPSDAPTYSQLMSVSQSAQQGISTAYKGVAMGMAVAGAAGANARPGETAVALGSGYFEGNSAVGVGVASSSNDGERTFRFGSALSPGLADVGIQASYQMRVGRSSLHVSIEPAQPAHLEHQALPVPFSFWKQHGFLHVLQVVPGRSYTAMNGSRLFRLSVGDAVSDSGTQWAVEVDEMLRDGQWRHVAEMDRVKPNNDASLALQSVIEALGKYAH